MYLLEDVISHVDMLLRSAILDGMRGLFCSSVSTRVVISFLALFMKILLLACKSFSPREISCLSLFREAINGSCCESLGKYDELLCL